MFAVFLKADEGHADKVEKHRGQPSCGTLGSEAQGWGGSTTEHPRGLALPLAPGRPHFPLIPMLPTASRELKAQLFRGASLSQRPPMALTHRRKAMSLSLVSQVR